MGKNILLLIAGVIVMQSLSAQEYDTYKKFWFDLQAGQHIGLSKWNDTSYANDGLPGALITELRGVANLYLAGPYMGAFLDMGIGVMPAPKMRSLELNRMPMPNSGTKYYLREMTSESGPDRASAHFKITAGLFGDFRATDKLNVMPYLGAGSMSVTSRSYDVILKEDGSNTQYNTTYLWGKSLEDDDSHNYMLAYFTARLNFRHKISASSSLLFGLEYTCYFQALNFYGRYTNTFNGNIQREVMVKGNRMNMLALSIGISFR